MANTVCGDQKKARKRYKMTKRESEKWISRLALPDSTKKKYRSQGTAHRTEKKRIANNVFERSYKKYLKKEQLTKDKLNEHYENTKQRTESSADKVS